MFHWVRLYYLIISNFKGHKLQKFWNIEKEKSLQQVMLPKKKQRVLLAYSESWLVDTTTKKGKKNDVGDEVDNQVEENKIHSMQIKTK